MITKGPVQRCDRNEDIRKLSTECRSRGKNAISGKNRPTESTRSRPKRLHAFALGERRSLSATVLNDALQLRE
jgi:hypothetical protein